MKWMILGAVERAPAWQGLLLVAVVLVCLLGAGEHAFKWGGEARQMICTAVLVLLFLYGWLTR